MAAKLRIQILARNQAGSSHGTLHESTVAVSSLVPNPRNPRSHPEVQIGRLAASIRRFGQTRPVLVRRENRMIVAGHGVALACARACLADIRVVLWDVDQATADAFMLGDNRLGQLGEDDSDRIRELLREMGLADVTRATTSMFSKSRRARWPIAFGSAAGVRSSCRPRR